MGKRKLYIAILELWELYDLLWSQTDSAMYALKCYDIHQAIQLIPAEYLQKEY